MTTHNKRIRIVFALAIGIAWMAEAAPQKQYWDTSPIAGYQHGGGNWSLNPADTNWTLNGTVLDPWTSGNYAYFNGTNGNSTIWVDSVILTSYWLSADGSAYDIVVTNGGEVTVSGSEFILGYGTNASNNTFSVFGGAGVTSRLVCGAASVGRPGVNNTLLVDGAGVSSSAVFQATSMSIGNGGTASSRMIIRRGGVWNPTATVNLGNGSSSNEMTIENGGLFSGSLYAGAGGGDENTFRLTGASSLATIATLVVGMGGGDGNRWIVDNGATLTKSSATFIIGYGGRASFFAVTNRGVIVSAGACSVGYSGASASTALVSDASSTWDNGAKNIVIGDNSSNTVFIIASEGVLTNAAAIQIGSGVNGLMNHLVVTGGGRLLSKTTDSAIGYTAGTTGNTARLTGSRSLWDLGGRSLTIGTLTGSGNRLTVDDGGCLTNAGVITVVSNNAFWLLGGSLVSGRIVATGDVALAVGDGVQAAALILTNKALTSASSFSPGLRIENNGRLAGTAMLSPGPAGVVVAAGGIFAPGIGGVGAITNIGLITFEANSAGHFEIATNTAPGTGWDFLAVTNGALTLGGTLKPVLKAGYLPLAADRFTIMTNRGPGSVSGTFGNAGNGQSVTVFEENGTTVAGTFTVEIGGQGVTLRDFQVARRSGTIIVIR